MESVGALKKCKQSACKVSLDGKCLEGLELDKCPHFYFDEIDENRMQEASSVKLQPQIALFTGEELSLKDIKFLTFKFRTKIIMIIGEADSGKSTLLAVLHDLFQLGPFANFLFAGSTTQIGFERRCHPSRLNSNASTPDTERTKTNEFNFLHLAVKKKDEIDNEASHLLLSDISGEKFRLARDSSASMLELDLLKSVNNLIILIDGLRVSNKLLRAATILNAATFIVKALDEKIFNSSTRLNIVLSKWDCLYNDKTFDFTESIEKPFLTQFSNRLEEISFSKIAARPDKITNGIGYGYGLAELLTQWVSNPMNSESLKVDTTRYNPRYFGNYRSS
jgi:energy-coupling factor transporter ATP-binding protein EcfA2